MKPKPLTETDKEILNDWREKDRAAKEAWQLVLSSGLYYASLSIPDGKSDWRNPPSVTEAGMKFWSAQSGQVHHHLEFNKGKPKPAGQNRKKVKPEIDLMDEF